MQRQKPTGFGFAAIINAVVLIILNLALSRASAVVSLSDTSVETLESRDSLPFLGSNFINLAFHASIVVDNTLYIDGGEINWKVNGEPQGVATLNSTLSIDLSQSWNPSTVAFQSFPKDGPSDLVLGSLWEGGDGKSFYAFGGSPSHAPYANSSVPSTSFWQFSNGAWRSVDEDANSFPSATRPASGLAASGNGVGYMLGGFDSLVQGLSQGYVPLPGIVSYNMTSGAWSNESALGFSYDSTAFSGAMKFLPNFGSNGLLVAMGGEISKPSYWSDEGQNMLSFSNISVYDPYTRTWYWQSATGGPGDIPVGSSMFCAVGAQSSDSTYEIFIYGGHNDSLVNGFATPTQSQAEAQAKYNVVYVLSLPAFVWFKSNDTSGHAKYAHTCENLGNGQMVSIGGHDPSGNFTEAGNVTDVFPQGLGIFNMVNMSWASSYDPNAGPYTAPEAVKAWYSRPDSNSSVNWISPELKALFLSATAPNSTSTAPTSPGTSSSTPSSAPSSSSLNLGAIIGGVIGGVLGAIALFVLAWFLLRWRRERRRRSKPMELHADPLQELGGLGTEKKSPRKHDLTARPLHELGIEQPRSELDGRGVEGWQHSE